MMFMRKTFYVAAIVVLAAAGVAIGLPRAGKASPVAAGPPVVHPQAAQPTGQEVIVVWLVGSPWTGQVPNRNEVPWNIRQSAERLGNTLQIRTFAAKGFAEAFFSAFKAHNPPDVLAFDNHGVITGLKTPSGYFQGIGGDPEVRRALVRVTISSASPRLFNGMGGFEYLIRTSPHYQAARALFLRPPDCGGVSLPADLGPRAIRITRAYLEGSPGLRSLDDPDLLHATATKQQRRTVSATKACGYWGFARLAFLQTVSTYESPGAIGQVATLLALRKRKGQWRLLVASTDPVSNTSFVEQLPQIRSRIERTSRPGRTPKPAQLLSPPDGVYPKPPKDERSGDFRWRPSLSQDVVAEIVEFAYNANARLFAIFSSGRPPSTEALSAGHLWYVNTVWKWRVWSISRTGAISFSQSRWFPGRGAAVNVNARASRLVHPEFAPIFRAEREGRWLDAKKLVNAEIDKTENVYRSPQVARMLVMELARVEFNLGYYAKAAAAAERGMAMDKARTVTWQVAGDLGDLANYSEQAGNLAAARRALEERLTLARRSPGPGNSWLLSALAQFAGYERRNHRTEAAKKLDAEAAHACMALPQPRPSRCDYVVSTYYRETGRAKYAEQMLSRLAAQAPAPGAGNRLHAYQPMISALNILAIQHEQDHSYDLAATTYRRAIKVIESAKDGTLVAAIFYDKLGQVLVEGKRDAEAEAAYKRAIKLRENYAGPDRSMGIFPLVNAPLAYLYEREGRLSDAEAVLRQILADEKQAFGASSPQFAMVLVKLAEVESRGHKYSEAAALCEQALNIREASLGRNSPKLSQTLDTCARIEQRLGNAAKAKALAARARMLAELATKP